VRVGVSRATPTTQSTIAASGSARAAESTDRPTSRTRIVTTVRRTAPHAPSGHGTVAPGTTASARAMRTIPSVGRPGTHASHPARVGDTSATPAHATPPIVAIGTSGAASRLATTATTDTDPCSSTMIGPHTTCAASGTATAGPSRRARRGRRRPIASPHGPAKMSSPSVARVDNTNPYDRASHGSHVRTARIAPPSTGNPADR
jgi:hypothetical protein